MNLFKSASTSSGSARPRPSNSIRGKISGPIPILNPVDDDEFPIRHPGSNLATDNPDDEFPIRQRGAGIASPTPLPEDQPTMEDQPESQRPEVLAPPPPAPASTSGSSSRNDDELVNGSALHEPSLSANAPTQPQSSSPPPASMPEPIPTPAPAAEPIPSPARPSTPQRMSNPSPAVASAVAAEPAATPATPPVQKLAPVRASPSSGSGTSPGHKRTNPSSTLRYSVVTNSSGNTAETRPQRKKSTLRVALSKLFGRKKKKAGSQISGNDTDRTSSVVPSSQHRSDTSGLARVNEMEPKRSASLPITEYDRALRSHSVGPNDITAIESARNSMHADTFTSARRRAVTATQSNLFGATRTFHRKHDLGEWGGLSPRPVSSHGRGSRTLHGDDDPSMIGRAITSDMAGEFAHKRRSRSLSGLDLSGVPGSSGSARRRSDEIRYWRESYGPSYLSPLSSSHPENEGENNDDNDDTGALSADRSQAPSTVRPATEAAPKTPPQPFNFGSFATMNEMAGMKITQAVGLDERMGNIESRTYRLERVVNQLCYSVPGFKGPMENRDVPRSVAMPPGVPPAALQAISTDLRGVDPNSSRYSFSRQSAETMEGNASHLSFGEGQTYIGSVNPPSSAATQSLSIPAISGPSGTSSPGLRPTSTSTVRGATSLPALTATACAQEHHLTSSVDTLTAQLEAERAARAALETQVKKLSERMNTLSSTMFAMLRDPHKSKSQERLATSRSQERLASASAGDIKSPGAAASSPRTTARLLSKPSLGSMPSPMGLPRPVQAMPQPGKTSFGGNSSKPPVVKTLSVFEGDGDEEDSEREEGSADAFQTPREERSPHPFGAFGEELRDETDDDELDPKRKKAARTLSLSQLTLAQAGQRNVI